MKIFDEQKIYLRCYAALFFLFGFLIMVCGTLFENENSDLSKHQETVYRQDQVHYWAGIPFIILGIMSVLFVVLENNFLLKFCICCDFICINIAIFVIIVEGPDWKKYQAKSNNYNSSAGHIDYEMIKPQQDYGSNSQLSKSSYDSAMFYSGTWVFIAICSILLGVETFLTHIKVYCGIESIYAYISGYEVVNPEITLKTAKPNDQFQCKGCQTKPPTPTEAATPSESPTKAKRPMVPRSPPTVIRVPMQMSVPDGNPKRGVSPTLSDASNASNAFYVCQESCGIKLVAYKPRRQGLNEPHLSTHHEEEESPTDYYHFSRKHPNEVEDLENVSRESPRQESRASLAIPTPPPLPPLVFGNHPDQANDPFASSPVRFTQDPRVSPSLPKPPALSPIVPQSINASAGEGTDRSPGKYPSVGDIFPLPPSALPGQDNGREKGKVSFLNRSTESSATISRPKRNSKLDTLF